MDYRMISPDAARAAKGYLMPGVAEHPDFEKLFFYAAVEENGALTGLLAIDPAKEEAELLSIGMSPEYCGKGYGSGLLQFAAKDLIGKAREASLPGLRLAVNFILKEEEEDRLSGFFRENSFFPEEDCPVYRVPLSVMKEAPYLKEALKRRRPAGLLKLAEVPGGAVNAFGNKILQEGLYPGLNRQELDEEISVCYMPDKEILACALFAKEKAGLIRNTWMYVSPEASEKLIFPLMLAESLEQALKSHSGETPVEIMAAEKASADLFEKIFAEIRPSFRIASYVRLLPADEPGKPSDELVFEEVSAEHMYCKDCVHNTGKLMECAIYSRKPDAVVSGESCLYFEAR